MLIEFSKCKHELYVEEIDDCLGKFRCRKCGYLWICDIDNRLGRPVCMFILDTANRAIADYMPKSFPRNHDWKKEWK